jgi:hypothetical protein
MREDLVELKELRSRRHDTLWAGGRIGYLFNRDSLERDEIFFLNQILLLGTDERYFSANTSGFEALKVSGVLNRLQGSSLEQLMSAYYDNVAQIERLEGTLYDAIRPLSIEMGRDQPRELADFEILNPAAVPDERFEELQPVYREFVNHPLMRSFGNAQYRNAALILNYDSLSVIGETFIQAVESGTHRGNFPIPRTPKANYMIGLGEPRLVINGRPDLTAKWLTTADSNSVVAHVSDQSFRFDSIEQQGDELHIEYLGDSEWAVVYWSATSIAKGRSEMDYSGFEKLVLEMKGDQGGERIKVHVKDADYPDNIAPVSVEITLNDTWQIYELDLDEFAPNDFSRLHVVLGLLIFPAQDPMTFSIRNAEYR